MLKISITEDFSRNFAGKHLPKGALWAPIKTERGEKAIVFADDIGMLCRHMRFTLVYLYANGKEVRRYDDAAVNNLYKSFRNAALALPESARKKAVYAVLNKDLARAGLLPKERNIPVPNQRCRMSPRDKSEDYQNGNEQRYVTDGVQVGSRRFNDIGYHAQRLGVRYEWYGNDRPTITAAEDAAFREFFNNGGFTAAE